MFLRSCVAALALLGLAGCDAVSTTVADGLALISAPSDATGEGIRTLALLDGSVRVRGPEGYCIDQSASDARRGFGVVVGCALLSDDAAIMPTLDGLILVQFGAEGTASVANNEDAFASFLASQSGRAILAANGDAASVLEVATVVDRSAVLARFEDASGPAFEGTSGAQWRGFLDVGTRLATVSVLSFDRNPLTRAEGERLLVVALAELAEVNAPPVQASQLADENG